MRIQNISEFPSDATRNIKMSNNSLKQCLIDFYNSGQAFGAVIFSSDEYSSSASLYTGIMKAVKNLELPFQVKMIHGEIYIRRMD